MVKVLIADECPMLRLGLGAFLESVSGTEVVGEATSAEDTLRLATGLRPDLIFIEPNFSNGKPRRATPPRMDLCRVLKALPHSPRVVFYTAHNHPADVAAATLAGADGYLHKSLCEQRLKSAVEKIVSGKSEWLYGLDEVQTSKVLHASLKVSRLTPREQAVFRLLLWRYSAEGMASELHVRPQTIRNYVARIKMRLGYNSRQELYEEWGI